MKRIFAMLLCVLFLLPCISPVFVSAEGEEPVYGMIPIQFSYGLEDETTEYLDAMIRDGHVYIDSQSFAEYLGYQVSVETNKMSINNSTGYAYSSSSTVNMEFPYDSTQIKRTICGDVWCDELESPFPTMYDGEKVWVPMEYLALLLNATIKPLEDRVLVTMPEKKAPDLVYDVSDSMLSYFSYGWEDAFGEGLSGLIKRTGQKSAGWYVSRMSRVLSLDIWDNIRRVTESRSMASITTTAEYGETYATLFCTFSNDELKAETQKVSAISGVFSNAVVDSVSNTRIGLDSALGSLKKELDSIRKSIASGGSDAVHRYNKVDLELQKLDAKYSSFESVFGAYSEVQEGVSKQVKILDVICYAVDFVNYESEFYNQDKQSVAILKKYLENKKDLPASVEQGIKGQVNALENEGFCYGVIRSGFDIAGDTLADGFTTALGLPATMALVAWDIISNTVPFYSEGLKATDEFELSEVAIQVNRDAYAVLDRKNAYINDRMNPETYFELANYSYNWLKSCYISRAAAIASLDTAKEKENVSDFIAHQQDINKQIAWYLVRLKEISDPSTLNAVELIDQYGLFPEVNKEYLNDYAKTNIDVELIPLVEEGVSPEFFESLPEEFVFSSGVGGWRTIVTLADDGTFIGNYIDGDYGSTRLCDFKGKFSAPKQINEYTYSVNLDYLTIENTPGEAYYKDGIEYIYAEPYGFDNAEVFLIYLPGAPIDALPEEFVGWARTFFNPDIKKTLPLGLYGLYNVNDQYGFVGYKEFFEDKNYEYRYIDTFEEMGVVLSEERQVQLSLDYYNNSFLWFRYGEEFPVMLSIPFAWDGNRKQEYSGTDTKWGYDFDVSLEVRDDYSKVFVKVISADGFDFTQFGGTSDGSFYAEFDLVG